MEKDYKSLGYFFLLVVPLILIGFYPSYFALFPTFNERIDYLVHLHFALSMVWVAILIVQPFLIVNRKLGIHKKIGQSTYVIFPLWVASFLVMIFKKIEAQEFMYLVFPIGNMLILIILYILAIRHRKNTAKHMRYMIASALVLLDPTVGRWTFNIFHNDLIAMPITYALMNLILVFLIWKDRQNGKDYTPYVVSLGCFLAYNVAFFVVYLS